MKIHRNGVLLSADDGDETEIVFALQLYGEKKLKEFGASQILRMTVNS